MGSQPPQLLNTSPTGKGKTTSTATSAATSAATSTATSAAKTLANTQKGVSTKTSVGEEANSLKSSTADYAARSSAVGANRQKVALVGRTGAGTTDLTSISVIGGSDSTIGSLNDKNGNPILSTVIFEATPDMSESGRTQLIDIGDIRAAASIVIYMGSPSRAFNLNAKFISRTKNEAAKNNNYINILKAWRMPVIKRGEKWGAEPETLRLFAYGNIIRGIPVMVESLTVEYSSESDYIETTDANNKTIWVPIIQNVTIGLKEVRSMDDLGSFDYKDYKTGNLDQW